MTTKRPPLFVWHVPPANLRRLGRFDALHALRARSTTTSIPQQVVFRVKLGKHPWEAAQLVYIVSQENFQVHLPVKVVVTAIQAPTAFMGRFDATLAEPVSLMMIRVRLHRVPLAMLDISVALEPSAAKGALLEGTTRTMIAAPNVVTARQAGTRRVLQHPASGARLVAQAQLVATSLLANHARQARFQH